MALVTIIWRHAAIQRGIELSFCLALAWRNKCASSVFFVPFGISVSSRSPDLNFLVQLFREYRVHFRWEFFLAINFNWILGANKEVNECFCIFTNKRKYGLGKLKSARESNINAFSIFFLTITLDKCRKNNFIHIFIELLVRKKVADFNCNAKNDNDFDYCKENL